MANGMGIASGAASGAAAGTAIMPGWGTAAGALIGGITGAIGGKSGGTEEQEKLMKLQEEANQRLMAQSYEQQREMYDYTFEKNTPEAMYKLYKEAGLNPALMYGQSGGGVTGQSAGSGNAQVSGQAGATSAEKQMAATQQQGMSLQLAKIASEIKLTNAQADNLNVDSKKKAGVDTELATSMMNKIIQETTNEEVKRDLMELQKAINQNDLQQGREILNGMIRNNVIGNKTINDVVKGIRAEATGRELENSKILAITNLTDEQKEAISVGLAQKWQELSVQWKNATTAERDVIVKETLRDIKEERPTTGEISGQVVKKVFNGMYEWADKIDKKLGLDRFAPKTTPLK